MSQAADALTRLRQQVAGAVTRGARAAAEARERTAGFRESTRALAEQARERPQRTGRGDLTDGELSRESTAFRAAAGLPVAEFPSEEDPRPAGTAGPEARDEPFPRRGADVDDGDDEDFSQQRILC
ncbi:hypothetical protein C1701_13515 [Actinoalloteichus sp. AHMU CJ021]|uniref:hypothetical protein n=1 Tax=Actinoalloteichus sp. AHMU CJ021 TaxID=2072503 RepID=UPI000CA03975|nr:hypothetical protein C1701_13515 [Actinoalloteichus sp. AHMU CJ021]